MAYTRSIIMWEVGSNTTDKTVSPLGTYAAMFDNYIDDARQAGTDAVNSLYRKVLNTEDDLLENTPTEQRETSYRSLTLDCVMQEAHSINNEITSYPVSTGFSISDHTIRRNPVFKMQGWVTNVNMPTTQISITNVGKVAGAMVNRSLGPVIGSLLGSAANLIENIGVSGNPVKEAYETLKGLIENGTIVHVSTLVGTYENCVLRSMEISQNVMTASVLPITLTFEKIYMIDAVTGEFLLEGQNQAIQTALNQMTPTMLQSTVSMLTAQGVNIFAEWVL